MSYTVIPKKTLNCRECGEPVQNVGSTAVAVTCSKCVILNHFGGHFEPPEVIKPEIKTEEPEEEK
jgi:phage FluMu protein Com